MTDFSIQIDQAALDDIQERMRFIRNGYERASTRALNYAAKQAQSLSAKAMSDQVTTTQKTLKESISIEKATFSKLNSKLKMDYRPIAASKFKYSDRKKSKRGVASTIFVSRTVEWPQAFVATLKSGHVGIYVRKKVGGVRVGRLPIDEIVGIAVPTLFSKTPGLSEEIESLAGDKLVSEFGRQVDLLIAKELGTD